MTLPVSRVKACEQECGSTREGGPPCRQGCLWTHDYMSDAERVARSDQRNAENCYGGYEAALRRMYGDTP